MGNYVSAKKINYSLINSKSYWYITSEISLKINENIAITISSISQCVHYYFGVREKQKLSWEWSILYNRPIVHYSWIMSSLSLDYEWWGCQVLQFDWFTCVTCTFIISGSGIMQFKDMHPSLPWNCSIQQLLQAQLWVHYETLWFLSNNSAELGLN